MDISISSNFERLLFDLAGRDSDLLRAWMVEFERTDRLTLPPPTLAKAREDFMSCRVDEEQTLATMREFHDEHAYILCPHSAVGVSAAKQLGMLTGSNICLATAHHAKFVDAMKHLPDPDEDIPTQLRELDGLPTKSVSMPASTYYVKKYIDQTLEGKDSRVLLRCLAVGNFFWMRKKWMLAFASILGASALISMQVAAGQRRKLR